MPGRCGYRSPLDNWQCPEDATSLESHCIFHDPNLNKDVEILKARFEARLADEREDPLRFDGGIFTDGISFENVTFKRDVWFYQAQFRAQQNSFLRAQFHGQVDFVATKFHGQKNVFDGVQFHGQSISFVGAQFDGQETSFDLARFYGQTTSFLDAQFRSKRTSFNLVEFHSQRTSFIDTQFHSEVTSFSGAAFRNRVIFKGEEPSKVFAKHTFDVKPTVDFGEVRVDDEGEIVFDWVDLSQTSFFNSDLSKMRFFDVTWDHRYGRKIGPLRWGGWRLCIYDETSWRAARKKKTADMEYLSHLGRLYRALKAYYRGAGEHHLVGHFHYGLMEVQWYQKEAEAAVQGASWFRAKLKKWVSWEAAYRYSSGYGEDYGWAGLLLVGILLVSAGLYWSLGVPSAMHGEPWWKQGLHALLYSFQGATLGRVEFYSEKVRLAARYVHLIESILVPVQFGFFLLALRNRFRR